MDDQQDLDAFIDRLDYALFVVTVGSIGGEQSGCVAGFVTQCSIVPLRLLVCVSKVNHTFGVAEQASGMALHLIGQDQDDVFRLFAETTGDVIDKFEAVDWHAGRHGAPILDHCAGWIEGTLAGRLSVGDHEAFVFCPTDGGGRPTSGAHVGHMTMHTMPEVTPGHPVPE